jgi:hypothetical protein
VRVCTAFPGDAYCFATAAACPCSNANEPFAGCAHASGGGASLDVIGVASVAHDTLRLSAASMQPTTIALFIQGTAPSMIAFGDGLGCTGGTQRRLGTRATTEGAVSFGSGVGNDPPISQQGAIPVSGGSRYYQVIYRDASTFCTTSSTFNTTNGIAVAWAP